MKVLYIDYDGACVNGLVEVQDGLTAEQFFRTRFPDGNFADYLVRVNRRLSTAEDILEDGDRVNITLKKIWGHPDPGQQRPPSPAVSKTIES